MKVANLMRRMFCGALLAGATLAFGMAGAANVVEYLNTLDFPAAPGGHYFYSADPAEQAMVDSGAAGRFHRTGLVFYTGGDTPVCRFYGSVTPGPNSHFFTADAQECAGLRSLQVVPTPGDTPQWNYEGLGFTVVAKAPNGSCPAGAVPVHRAYNNGFARGVESNHRYSTSRDALDGLVSGAGWVHEGVVFCTQLPAGQSPLISEALSCGTLASAGGLGPGNQVQPLQRHTIDLAKFPDAQCNDGTAAVFYFRPYSGAANRDKWVLQLQGGGGCGSGDACAARWCSVDDNFGMTQMTANVAPAQSINGLGILARAPEVPEAVDNPHGNYNHVFLRYCSSDAWAGTRRDASFVAAHPHTLQPVNMRAHFLGSKILDAAIATLRQDGVSALQYAYGQPTGMPDLDQAEEVLLAGASAGGGGVTNNLDRLRDALRASNARCQGQTCPLVYRGLIDSHFGPSVLDLDLSRSLQCQEFGACSAEALLTYQKTLGQGLLHQPRMDQSCFSLLTPLGTDWKCFDDTYVIRNHLTTPFFLRMGLTDSLLSRNQIEAQFALPGQPVFTLETWAQKVRADLLALADLRNTAADGQSIAVAPGVYGPVCSKHETLRSNEDTYGVNVRVGTATWSMFEVWGKWLAGQSPSSIVSSSTTDAVCPGDQIAF